MEPSEATGQLDGSRSLCTSALQTLGTASASQAASLKAEQKMMGLAQVHHVEWAVWPQLQ
jgi:hypothetical protein